MHKNTRLDRDPFSKALNKSQIQQAAALNAQVSVLLSYCHLFVENKFCIDGQIFIAVWFSLFSSNRERWAQTEKSSYHTSPQQWMDMVTRARLRPRLVWNSSVFPDNWVTWNMLSFLIVSTTLQSCRNNCVHALLRISTCNRILYGVHLHRYSGVPPDDLGWDWEHPVPSGWIRHAYRRAESSRPVIQGIYDPGWWMLFLRLFSFTEVVIICCLPKIPEPGRRERLGLKMANEAAAKNRAKKQEALRKVTENLARWICFFLTLAIASQKICSIL